MPEEKKRDPILIALLTALLAVLGYIAIEVFGQSVTTSAVDERTRIIEKNVPLEVRRIRDRINELQKEIHLLSNRVTELERSK